jgi:hypothetical protein
VCALANAAPLSTDGIEINQWNLAMPWGNDAPVMDLSAWDFAGTERERIPSPQPSLTLPYTRVVVEDHDVPYVRARIGCAGQEIYYSTHQFFLSERSLYVVVFNLLAPEQSHVEYWYVILFSSLSLSPLN